MKDHFSPGRTTKPLWCMLCAISPNKKKKTIWRRIFAYWKSVILTRDHLVLKWPLYELALVQVRPKPEQNTLAGVNTVIITCVYVHTVFLYVQRYKSLYKKMSLLGLVVSPVHVTFSVLRNSRSVSLVMPMLFLTCSRRLCFPFLPVLCSLS